MSTSAKTEYACIAMLELSLRYSQAEPVRVRNIADAYGIPSRFLVQILLQLKGVGLVQSTRGASGGYQLCKDPAEITLGQVMTVIEGPDQESVGDSPTEVHRVLRRAWDESNAARRDVLDTVTFADLVEQLGESTENMYYI